MKIEQTDLVTADVRQLIDPWLEKCPSATIYHTTGWNLIVQDVFATACRYFLALDGGELVGVFPCHFVRSSLSTTICYSPPRSYEVSYGGPVAIGPESAQICKALVKAAACARVGVVVEIYNSPQNSEWAIQSGWKWVASLESAYVDLKPDLAEIWRSSLNGKRRNEIRKAEKKGVQVQFLGIDGLDQYYALTEEMAERARIPLQPKSYYRRILDEFGPRDQARLYLAFHNRAALAGGIFLRYQKMCYYWVGATASMAENLGQGEALQWEAIQWAKGSGCEWYDLVGVDRERLPHIATFKLGFTRQVVIFQRVYYATVFSRALQRLEHSLWRHH
jgi:hypothetical protein